MTKAQKAQLEERRKAVGKLVGYLASRALVSRYDALRRDPVKKPVEIRVDFSETQQNFYAEKRILAYALTENLYDNSPIGSTLDTAIRLTIGQRGGTPLFTGEDKEFATAFYNDWKRHCGYCEGENLQEMLALILRIVKLKGDCVIWVDPVLTGGKIRLFDADQICNVAVPDWERFKAEHNLPDSARQIEGVVVSGDGRVLGYFCTMLRNRYGVSLDDAIFLPTNTCRRVAYHRKHTQYRGEPAILANQAITEDTTSLLKSEVAAAKLASELPLIIEEPDNFDASHLSSLLEGYENIGELTEGTGVSPEDLAKLTEAAQVDEVSTFKAFEGKASLAKVKNGTKVTNLTNAARPSTPIQSWVDVLNDQNGKTLGVMSLFSRGRADNSYSSGMIEIEVSWKQFEEDQKLLERYVIDYCMEVLLPNSQYEVYWDKSIQIDAEKYEKVADMQLRGGRTTYRELLGADWKNILLELAEEKKYLKSIGLDNLSFFQTSNGNETIEVQEEHKDGEADSGKPTDGDNEK